MSDPRVGHSCRSIPCVPGRRLNVRHVRAGRRPAGGAPRRRRTGGRGRYLTDENYETLADVRAVADDLGATPAQVSLAWLRHRDVVTAPVVGARTVDQLEENLGAADLSLSDSQVQRLADA